SEEIREALKDPFDKIVGAVKSTLEKTSPELASDLITNGLVLVGGGALIRGLDKLLAQETGLPVQVGNDPLTAVARGTGYLLENLDLYKTVLQDEDIHS
ncbi:MAG TPA: rod shape-determining protein, partial [Candidatus Wunengus sp. YC65]|uniref:rod shape-determining protein n=1 Tax=Candidatus Wunengus sp. YC65 TaxID=3367701 RepID=UPI004029E8F8